MVRMAMSVAGLLGSTHYVNDLKSNDPKELAKITMMLDIDMIGAHSSRTRHLARSLAQLLLCHLRGRHGAGAHPCAVGAHPEAVAR